MLKKILPVGIGIVLIVLIALTVTLIKKGNNRTPSITDADKTYVSYENLNVTYDRVYNYMKNGYGTAELLTMVDEKLYEAEMAAIDVNSEDYINYVKDQVFSSHDFTDLTVKETEELQKKWDDLIISMKMTGVVKASDVDDSNFTNESSNVWKIVKDYYKLSYARTESAKKAYWNRYLKNRNDDNPFDMTNKEDADNSIEAYFKANYTGKVVGLFIPFLSEKEALAAMEKHGVNVDSNVLPSNDGWVKSSYDYYSKAKVEDSDKMSYKEVVEAFFAMYNDAYKYLNDGNDILTPTSYTEQELAKQTAYTVSKAIKDAFSAHSEYGISVTLPTTVAVNGGNEATILWAVSNSTYGKVNEAGNVVSADFTKVADSETEINLNLNFSVKYGDETVTSSLSIICACKRDEADPSIVSNKDSAITEVAVGAVDKFMGYKLNADMYSDEYLEACDNLFRFIWTAEDAKAINATLADYLTVSSTKLVLSDNPSELYKSYTVSPVSIGDYYFLILKLENQEQTDLFEKDADGNNKTDDNGKYIIKDQALYDEIVEKKKEALLTENALNEMSYVKRYEAGLKIYDAYIEAIYEYEYKNFYETTLSTTDYNKYEKTKKNKKALVAEFKVGDNKVEISADDLFNRMEPKYAGTAVSTFLENYKLIADEHFNSVYNPYTNKVLDETSYKDLLTSEISTLKQNFEADYFTYSYLSYYGFTPNFSSDYGWQKFIKDYFNAYSDQELLTTSSYGGTIYSDALALITDESYTEDDLLAKMQEASDKWFSLSVINLIVSIDTNYNANSSDSNSATISMEEKNNWTDKQIELAKELASFFFEVAPQTNGSTIAEQLTALVTLYKNASNEYNETDWNASRLANASIYDYNYFGKYKAQGLNVKFETANTYTSTSSIVDEFKEECVKLWNKAESLDLIGKTFDEPLMCDEAFFTDYGLHYIGAMSADKKPELPTVNEIKLYRASKLLEDAETAAKTAQENIDKYKESGYNTTSYEASKRLADAKVAKYQAEWNKLLETLGLETAYELDAEAKTKLDAWYADSEKAIEGGTSVTRIYIQFMRDKMSNITFDASAKLNNTSFAEFVDLLEEACDHADNE